MIVKENKNKYVFLGIYSNDSLLQKDFELKIK